MATRERRNVGLAHPTVVPTNFEPAERRCPECGRPTDEHPGEG